MPRNYRTSSRMPAKWWPETKKMFDEAYDRFWSKRGGPPTHEFHCRGPRPLETDAEITPIPKNDKRKRKKKKKNETK